MTSVQAETIARRVALHLRKNNWEACHGILNMEQAEYEAQPIKRMAIAELKIDIRLLEHLERNSIVFVDQLKDVKISPIKLLPTKLRRKGSERVQREAAMLRRVMSLIEKVEAEDLRKAIEEEMQHFEELEELL